MYRSISLAAAWLAACLCLLPLSAAQAGILITIDKATQQMTVEVDGAPRWTWPVSTGRRGYDTPAGSFRAFRMEEDHYSKEWDDAPMPYSIFFTSEGHAIHGSYETRNLGRPASHGCVRIAPRNAEKLFALVKREGVSNARVIVREDPNAPIVAKREAPGSQAAKTQQATPGMPEQAFGYAPAQPAGALPTYLVRPPQSVGRDWN